MVWQLKNSEEVFDPMVFTVPSPCSFEEAMEITQSWLEAWEHGAMMPTDVVPQLTALLSSNEGVRGFFVIFLAGNSPGSDRLDPAIVQGLAQHLPRISSTLVKNLAMSTAMAVHHDRQNALDLAAGSQRVQQRCQALIQALRHCPEAQPHLDHLNQELAHLQESLGSSGGTYRGFLERWGYDEGQRQAIRQILHTLGA